MPIYEYVCSKCKAKFELLRPFSRSNENADCPKCKSKSERIMSRCYSVSTDAGGIPTALGGGSSCSSCSSGNCSSCGH